MTCAPKPPALCLPITSDSAAIAAVRRAVEAFCEVAGLGQQATQDVGLCVNEALANVIRHAYDSQPGRPIELTAGVEAGDAGEAVVVTLRDWGNGRVPDLSKAKQTAEVATLTPGGLGLPCLVRLLDDVVYEPQPDGMLLRMTKYKR